MAWWWIPGRCWTRSPASAQAGLNVTPEILVLAENAVLVLPLHRELDAMREEAASQKLGTTKRGIGPGL